MAVWSTLRVCEPFTAAERLITPDEQQAAVAVDYVFVGKFGRAPAAAPDGPDMARVGLCIEEHVDADGAGPGVRARRRLVELLIIDEASD
jgi:hypothetical protein